MRRIIRTTLARILGTPPGGFARGGLVQKPFDPPAEWSCVIHPAMHFDSREDMERYIFGREPE